MIIILNYMDLFNMFDSNACSLNGGGSSKWTWSQFYENKKKLTKEGVEVLLVDMIRKPVPDSVAISNDLLDGRYADGTYFVLYCHSGGSSGYLQKQLTPKFPQYKFINMAGGIGLYEAE